ncbi:MAG: dihydroorotate dehydrogenase electron transfer subunit [Bacteroidales bacterium]|nr:dihydroorotate dehydrogenase electron transfer subunit [Bacteroidales bacterium]MCF8404662.1 dihydroorotate dehydrogenase electron transfer subunit [Bacteroidales bacterium]
MKKIVADHILIKTENPAEDNFIIYLKSENDIPEIFPGNFAEILVPDSPEVFLRRPFSILDVDYKKRIISFYIKAIGKGTSRLGALKSGTKINLIYPLGNRYSIENNLTKVLIVGGGSGIAPFILLGKELKKRDIRATFLIGGRSKKDILMTEEFSKYGEVLMTTEDGTAGEKGLVTQHTVFKTGKFNFDKIYCCGPNPMMKAVGILAREKGIPCEASLENTMACGFGVCLCCVTATHQGNKRVCLEGPVFNVNDLTW